MFKTYVGPVEDEGTVAYLRPETAQGMFVNFLNVLQTSRKRPPFGIAQIGKSFRNEITPGNFVFRTREFEQMEIEYFVPPDRGDAVVRVLVPRAARLVRRARHPQRACCACAPTTTEELSHYSAATSDVEFLFPWGWGELEGIANRTDFDLKAHAGACGVRLEYFDQATGERYVPYVIEPAAGATRTMMAFLLAAYDEDEIGGERRTVLRLHPRLAPYQVAVLPLSRKDTLVPVAREVLDLLAADRHVRLRRDPVDRPALPAPGRDRHAAGVTVDFDTLEDRAVTIRDRDTTEQVRVPIASLVDEMTGRLDLGHDVGTRARPQAQAQIRTDSLGSARIAMPFVYAFDHKHRKAAHGAEGPARGQGRQPGRDDLGAGPAGAARLHHHDRRLPGLHGRRVAGGAVARRSPGMSAGWRRPWERSWATRPTRCS